MCCPAPLVASPCLPQVATARDPAMYEYEGALRRATNDWASGEGQGIELWGVGGCCQVGRSERGEGERGQMEAALPRTKKRERCRTLPSRPPPPRLPAAVTVHSGSATVTPAQYVEAVAALAPDAWVALSDDIPCDARSDRVPKAVDRTVAWLAACLQAAAGAPELAGAAAFAAVQGGQYLQERQRCAEVGLWLCWDGLHARLHLGHASGQEPA